LAGFIGQLFDGTIIPIAISYFAMGIASILCILVAEQGRMFTPDKEPHAND